MINDIGGASHSAEDFYSASEGSGILSFPSDEEGSEKGGEKEDNNEEYNIIMEEGRFLTTLNNNNHDNNNPTFNKEDPPEQAPISINTSSTRSSSTFTGAILSEEEDGYNNNKTDDDDDDEVYEEDMEEEEDEKIDLFGQSTSGDDTDDTDDDDLVWLDQLEKGRKKRVPRRGATATKKRKSTGSARFPRRTNSLNKAVGRAPFRRTKTLEGAAHEPSIGDFVKASETMDFHGRVPLESDQAAQISAEMKLPPSIKRGSRSQRIKQCRTTPVGKKASRDLISTQAEMQIGISVYYLKNHFLEEIFAAGLSLDSTIYDIEDLNGPPGVVRKRGLHVRCPIDGKMGAAYVHCLEGSHNVGPATHMLSYTWGYTIGDIVGTLVDFCKKEKLDEERTYFWICFLCVNQHRVVANTSVVPTSEFLATFGQRVSNTKEILCMMSPWEKPLYLQRIWCIYELSQAFSQHHVKVNIALPPGEKLSLVKDLLLEIDDTANSPVDVLYDALNNIKVEEAKASQEEDRRLILDLLEQQEDGCQGTNEMVKEHLKEHVLDILQTLGKQCSVFDAHQEAEVEEALSAAVGHFQELAPVVTPRQKRSNNIAAEASVRLERKHRRLKIAFGILFLFFIGLAVAWVLDSFLGFSDAGDD